MTDANSKESNLNNQHTSFGVPIASPNSFYRKPLPQTQIVFDSEMGKKIFREALQEGNLEGYFSLAAQFHTQNEPAYCGLGTLTMVLNAFSIDPGRTWKGVWRWYSEELLDCCIPLDLVKKKGITMDQFICLSRCNGLSVQVFYGENSSVEEFREKVKLCTQSSHQVLVVSYNRQGLGQTGSGHFSPIGGYNMERDLLLIMDVARFKYPPHWAPLSLLFESTLSKDPETGKSRGFMILQKSSTPSLFFRAISSLSEWKKMFIHFSSKVQLQSLCLEDFIGLIKSDFFKLISLCESNLSWLSANHKEYLQELQKQVQTSKTFQYITQSSKEDLSSSNILLVIFLLSSSFHSIMKSSPLMNSIITTTVEEDTQHLEPQSPLAKEVTFLNDIFNGIFDNLTEFNENFTSSVCCSLSSSDK